MPDYYELLGVSRDASEDEIKKAYRRLARELHPDTGHGDKEAEDRFKQISVAYEVLRDADRRRQYDMFGEQAVGAMGDPFSMFGDGSFGDIFSAFFNGAFGGGGAQQTGPPRGSDVQVAVELDLEQAIFGVTETVEFDIPSTCDSCGGTGAAPGSSPVTCTSCNGAGEVRLVRQSILGQMVSSSVCPRCGGTGTEIPTPCKDCRGDGRTEQHKSYPIRIPAGVDDGFRVRAAGMGAAGPRGGPAGDLYVHVRVRPHPRFRRLGDDIAEELHIAFSQAALGAELPYETLDGTEQLNIPAGTRTGEVFKFRGKGAPRLNARGRGDLLVQVVVHTPTDLSPSQEELLRKFAEEREEDVAPPESGLLGKLRSAFK